MVITKNVDPDIECSFAVKFVCITTFFFKVNNFLGNVDTTFRIIFNYFLSHNSFLANKTEDLIYIAVFIPQSV